MSDHVLGLDLSLSQPGAARVHADGHTVQTYRRPAPLPDTATDTERAARIRDHVRWIRGLLLVTTRLVVLEAPIYGSKLPGVQEMGGLWWAVRRMLALAVMTDGQPLPVGKIAPGTLKQQITGSGRADKDRVRRAVTALYPSQGLARASYDEADAVALATLGVIKLGTLHGRETWAGPWLQARSSTAEIGQWEHLPQPTVAAPAPVASPFAGSTT